MALELEAALTREHRDREAAEAAVGSLQQEVNTLQTQLAASDSQVIGLGTRIPKQAYYWSVMTSQQDA